MSLKNPDKKLRALPFWSWNGKLDKKELERQVGILEEMGFGGAFMHSRCGLSTEYMSKEWLSHVSDTADCFADKNMQGWLYDEDRWPSGSCGGLVTEKQENRQKSLSMYIGTDEGQNGKQVLGAFALRLTGEADKGQTHLGKRLADYVALDKDGTVPDGYERAVFVVEFIEPSDFYNGNTYLDTLNPSAVQDFIRHTHEKYKSAYGDKFGKELKGIFTDEPHRGGVFNGFNITNKNARAMLPWSYGTFDMYRKIHGEGVEDKLPELFFELEGKAFNRTVWRYLETVQEQFLRSFAIPYYKWCKQNGLLVTGHVWDENTLLGQINWQGSVMRYYEYMDIPGIDNLRDDNYFFAAPLQAVSVAKQTGRREILSEMYACTGWKTAFDYYKRSGDWQALLGINVRCPHLSWYTMGGEAKRDCPASIFFQAGWYKEYRYVEDYFARLKMTFGSADYLTDTLLISPIESAWGLVRAGNYSTSDSFKKTEADWRGIIDGMLFAGIDFDLADEDILAKKSRITVRGGVPYLAVGKMEYKTVVLPPLINIRVSTLNLLQAFAAHGGRIICAEHLPGYVNGKQRSIDLKTEITEISDLPKAVHNADGGLYTVVFGGRMLSKIKRTSRGYLLFLVAFDCDGKNPATVVLNGEHTVSEINLRTGETCGIPCSIEGGRTLVRKEFVKGEELLLAIGEKKVPEIAQKRTKTHISQTEFTYELNEPNALPLDVAAYSIDGEAQCEAEILKIDKAIRARYNLPERSANNRQPWFEEKFNGKEYNKKLCRVQLVFKFNAENAPDNSYLVVEDLPNAEWRFNGRLLVKSKDKPFVEDICFTRYDLKSDDYVIGKNLLTLSFDFTPACNLEAAYLSGDFAVNSRTVCKRPEKLRFGDLCEQGFPYYTGAVTYNLPVENGVYDVEDLLFGGACVRSGQEIAAFAPFGLKGVEVRNGVLPITAVLLRRNLFGPLHELPKNHGNYWSGSFRTEGDKFSLEYQLNEQGIFTMPEIYKKEERIK